jgi:hypothetical protein
MQNSLVMRPGHFPPVDRHHPSIPGPALAACITAVLCVKLGNQYGVSFAAQGAADSFIQGISDDRWLYYLDERLENDGVVLPKLLQANPIENWVALIKKLEIDPSDLKSPDVKNLIVATNNDRRAVITRIVQTMYSNNL